jgi:hypothetical protein
MSPTAVLPSLARVPRGVPPALFLRAAVRPVLVAEGIREARGGRRRVIWVSGASPKALTCLHG